MTDETFIALSPVDEIWVVSGWVTIGTKLIQSPKLLEKTDVYVLEYLQEFQLVQPENDIINFYTYDVLAPKDSTILCVSYPEIKGGNTTIYRRKSYLFTKGKESDVYQSVIETINQFIRLQVESHQKWECVTIYRPFPRR
jgi:hypothetical protein